MQIDQVRLSNFPELFCHIKYEKTSYLRNNGDVFYTNFIRNMLSQSPVEQKPWVVVAVFPGHKPKTITRTAYKSDADAQVRFLKRSMSNGSFYVVFDSAAVPEFQDA